MSARMPLARRCSATFQGTRFRQGPTPILNLAGPDTIGPKQQRGKLDLLAELNRRHALRRRGNSELEARIASYELAFRMQSAAPEAVDLSRETAETKKLYGLDDKKTQAYGRNCLLARRLAERGVRFIQLYHRGWDHHGEVKKGIVETARYVDQGVTALIKDLKRRGFTFVGPTICYAFMQAEGMVNDHLVDCFRYDQV